MDDSGVNNSDIITGTSTLFCRWPLPNDVAVRANNPLYYWYDPLNALNVLDQNGMPIPPASRKPVTPLYRNRTNVGGTVYEGFDDLASRYGTIFVYKKADASC